MCEKNVDPNTAGGMGWRWDEKGGGCGAGGGETPQILLYMTPLIAPTTHPRSAPYTEGLTDFIGGTPNPPFNIARFHLLETTDPHV